MLPQCLFSTVNLTSDSVVFDEQIAGQGSVVCVLLFSCIDSMSLTVRKNVLNTTD